MRANPKLIIHENDKIHVDWLQEGTLGYWIWDKLVHRKLTDKEFVEGIASCGIQVTDKIKPELHKALQEACRVLEIPEPELYLEECVDTIDSFVAEGKTFIMINPVFLCNIPEHLVQTVLVRECAHIYCEHNKARAVSAFFLQILKALSSTIIGFLAKPLEKKLNSSRSMGELTADRMALVYNRGMDELLQLCFRGAGFYEEEIPEGCLEAYEAQLPDPGNKIDRFINQKALRDYGLTDGKHPSEGLRIWEAKNWMNSEDYRKSVAWFWGKDQAKEVKLFYSAKDLRGKNTDEVQKALAESDLTKLVFRENHGKSQEQVFGKVTSVSINGQDDFESNLWFLKESEIIVCYDAKEKRH